MTSGPFPVTLGSTVDPRVLLSLLLLVTELDVGVGDVLPLRGVSDRLDPQGPCASDTEIESRDPVAVSPRTPPSTVWSKSPCRLPTCLVSRVGGTSRTAVRVHVLPSPDV